VIRIQSRYFPTARPMHFIYHLLQDCHILRHATELNFPERL